MTTPIKFVLTLNGLKSFNGTTTGLSSLMLNSYLVVLAALLRRGQPSSLPHQPPYSPLRRPIAQKRSGRQGTGGRQVASAGALYAFIISQWRKSKGREDERHLKRGYDNLHHHIKSKMDEVSGERPPGV